MNKIIIFVMLVLLNPIKIYGLSVEEYKTNLLDQNKALDTEHYIGGVGSGLLTASIYIEYEKGPIYCPPMNAIYTGKHYLNIINKAIDSDDYKNTKTVETILLYELKRIFPCVI